MNELSILHCSDQKEDHPLVASILSEEINLVVSSFSSIVDPSLELSSRRPDPCGGVYCALPVIEINSS